jgi:choline kinase
MGGVRPKTLINVGDHEPLLFYILKGLKSAEVDDLLVVTGFDPSSVTEFVHKHWGDEHVTFVRNTRYASWGNFHSVRMALDQSPGFDLLVVNSDIVINPKVFDRVTGTAGDLVLAVEERYALDSEDMRVRIDGDRVRDIGKDLERQFSSGEFCGVSLLRPPAHDPYRDLATAVEWRDSSTLYYEDIYKQMIGRVEARFAKVNSGEYAEVDNPDEMREAAEVIQLILPAWSDSPPQAPAEA